MTSQWDWDTLALPMVDHQYIIAIIIIIIRTDKPLPNGVLWTPEHYMIYENCNYIYTEMLCNLSPPLKLKGVLLTEKVEKSSCCSVVSNFLWPHGLQHSRFSCPSPSPRACSNSYPLSRWYHPTISSSVVSFSSCLQSFPSSGSFLVSQLFASGGQSVGTSALVSVLPVNIQDWFPLGLTGLWFDFLAVQETLKSLLQHHSSKASTLQFSAVFMVLVRVVE